jgi:hypothetical protein
MKPPALLPWRLLVLLNEDGEYITASHTHALDVIGVITRGGEWDDEGNVITPPEVLDGWHVNYVGCCLMGGRSLRCIRKILSGCGRDTIRPATQGCQ